MERFFADSCFLWGLKDPHDEYHLKANSILDSLLKNNLISHLEDLVISNFIIIEVFHGLHERIGFDRTKLFYEELRNFRIYHLKQKDIEEAIHEKLILFNNHIGLVDATNLFVMDKTRTHYLLSFDTGFNQIPLCNTIDNLNKIDMYFGRYLKSRKT